LKDLPGLQTAHKEAHPIPPSLLPRQMNKFAALLLGQNRRMDEKTAFVHVSPRVVVRILECPEESKFI
jgi:hypothetical protein